MLAKGTTGPDSLLCYSSFILLLSAWVWGLLLTAVRAVSHQPQHTPSMLHSRCHHLLLLMVRNGIAPVAICVVFVLSLAFEPALCHMSGLASAACYGPLDPLLASSDAPIPF